jgi:hypothetical protein
LAATTGNQAVSLRTKNFVRDTVPHLDHAVFETFGREQVQGCVTVTPRNQRNALPNEHRSHADDELVDGLCVKKRRDDPAAAHHPDILARLRATITRRGFVMNPIYARPTEYPVPSTHYLVPDTANRREVCDV